MIIKKHINANRLILAICDENLLGSTFEEGGKRLEVNRVFYEGEKISEEEIVTLIGKAYIINAVGRDSVACCAKAGLCDIESIPKIKGIPYFQAVLF